jgi:hypothetical protein
MESLPKVTKEYIRNNLNKLSVERIAADTGSNPVLISQYMTTLL